MAALCAWLVSAPIGRRVESIAAVARRYATGDLTRPAAGYGDDELGEVARALDGAVHELGRRVNDLAHDRRHLRAILSGMVEGVVVLDAQGRLVMANDAATSMLKLDGEATGRRYQEWMRQPELFAQVAQALEGEPTGGVEFVLARDPSRTCVSRAAPAGEPEGGAILVLHDISDLRRADRVRRDFVANVSHELRTPLTAIRGYVEALLDDPPGARREPAVPRDHRASYDPYGASGEGPAPPGAARCRTGDHRHGGVRCGLADAGRHHRPVGADRRASIAGRRAAGR